MRKIFQLLAVLLWISGTAFAQTTLPNGTMESWTDYGNYEEPDGGIWTTANKIVDLAPWILSPTTTKTTDAHSGTYAAKIETGSAFGQIASGVLATGWFDANANPGENLKMGTPFTGRPDKFLAWYKYTSVSGDSCAMYCLLTKWNPTLMKRDTIAEAAEPYVKTTVSTWTQLDQNFVYQSMDTPDTINVIFASSAAGEQFQGQVGSAITVDDIEVAYTTGLSDLLMPEYTVRAYPNPASDRIHFDFPVEALGSELVIFDLTGKEILRRPIGAETETLNLQYIPAGMYHYQVRRGDVLYATGRFSGGL